MSKTNSKFKTITFENHNEGAAKNLISVEQCVKNLEKSITLPLSENLSFHQIVLLSEEKKYKQQLIDSTLPIILKHLYTKKMNYEEPILNLINTLIDEDSINLDQIALNASFLDIAYTFLISAIRITKKNKLDNEENKNFEEEKMDIIADKHLKMTKLWIEIIKKFLSNQKSLKYLMENKFDIVKVFLIFLNKGYLTIKDQTIVYAIKMNIYKSLEIILAHDNTYINKILEIENNFTLIMINIRNNISNLQDFIGFMKIAALCTRYQKFQIILNGINLIDELFYRPMIRLLFSNYRDEKWKQYMVEYHPENGLLFCLSEILYNFTKNVEHKEKLLELLKLNNNDFSLRFLYQCILENNIKSIFYTITSISYLLMDSNYELPSYSDKLALQIFKEISRTQTPFILVCFLRIAKFITFTVKDKILVLKMLELHLKKLPFDFEHFVHIPLSNLDNYILFTNPENMIPPPKRKEIKNKRIEQNNENDLYNLTDISAIKKKEDSSSQRQNSPNKKNIGPNKKNSPSSPKFNFKKKLENNDPKKFLFKDENNNDFIFVKHLKCTCFYCESLKGFYCLNAKEFEDNIIDVLVLKYQSFKENEIYKENYLSIFQFIFDVTFEEDGLFIYKIVVPIMADILIDNNFNDKLKTTIFLYLNHLLINEKGFANILLSMEFFVFHEHFLCSFMQNFNLESFKFFRKNFSYNTETAKKTQENLQKVKDEKILETVSRKKGKEQNENAINQNIKNKSTAINHITIPSIIWNNENKKFEKIFKEVNEEQHAQNEKNKQDEIIGKMSKYFWRLHAFLHLLKIIQDFLKIYQSHLKDFIKEQFKDFVFQIVETCIIFNKFNDKFLPTEPFHSDTECWNEIRNILAEIMAILHQILLKLISKFSFFFNKFLYTLNRNPYYCKSFIMMIGKLPTLSSSRSLVTALFLYYDANKLSQKISKSNGFESEESPDINSPQKHDDKEVFLIYINTVAYELERIKEELKMILSENEKTLSNPEIFNKKAVSNILKLVISCVQTINLFLIEKSCLNYINLPQKNVVTSLLKSIFPLMKLSLHVHIKLTSNRNNKTNLTKRSSLKNEAQQQLNDKNKMKEYSIEELCVSFITILALFIYNLSHNSLTCEIILSSELFQFLISKLNEINYTEEALQCLMYTMNNICQALKTMDIINNVCPIFSNVLIDLFMKFKLSILNMLPLIKGMKTLILYSSNDSKVFRILVPKLRSLISLEPVKESETFKQKIKNLNISSIGNTNEILNETEDINFLQDEIKNSLNLEASFSGEFDESILSNFPPTKFSCAEKNSDSRQKQIFEGEVKDILKLLGTVQPGELQYGIQKIFNPRTKLIEGAGMISMKTLKDYGDQINNKKKDEDEKKVFDSLSFIKENQKSFNKKNNIEETSIDKNLISSPSFLQTHESHFQNNIPDFKNNRKNSLTINTGKLILKSSNTGQILINEFQYKNDKNIENNKNDSNNDKINSANYINKEKPNEEIIKKTIKNNNSLQNMSSLFKSISVIEEKKIDSQNHSINLLSNSQNSLFLEAGKTLLNKIDEEYLKILGKKNPLI